MAVISEMAKEYHELLKNTDPAKVDHVVQSVEIDSMTKTIIPKVLRESKRKTLTPFVFDDTLSPLEQEHLPLKWFQENWTTNPKKLVKMAKSIRPLLPDWINVGQTDNIIRAAKPVAMLQDFFAQMVDWPTIYQAMALEGNHGVINDRGKIYGVQINANPKWLKEDDKWNPDDALEIMYELLDRWMIANKRQTFIGTIVLFRQFGFDGIGRKISHGFGKEFWDAVTADGITQAEVERLLRTVPK